MLWVYACTPRRPETLFRILSRAALPASGFPGAPRCDWPRGPRALPTDTSGDKRSRIFHLPLGVYVLGWSNPFAGTEASEPIQIESGWEASFQRALPEGVSVKLHYDLDLCVGSGGDRLALFISSDAEIGPYLTGVSPTFRFSAAGTLTRGRLTPGSYLLRVRSGRQAWNKSVDDRLGGGADFPDLN